MALQIKGDRWQVRKDASGTLGDAEFRDICLLLPTRTGLDILEQALEETNVPYRIESQSMVVATEDVRELLNCLRAIASPADQVAVVAALRSSAFACSDVELLEFVDGGGRFDYFQPGAAAGPVAESLEELRKFHNQRVWTPPDQLIEQFIRDRRMVELSFGRPAAPGSGGAVCGSLWSRPGNSSTPVEVPCAATWTGWNGNWGKARKRWRSRCRRPTTIAFGL